MRLAVDAMGGDHGPEPVVSGVLSALETDEDLSVVLVGDQDQIEPHLDATASVLDRISFNHTVEIVGMDESPAKAMRNKPEASTFRCWDLLSAGDVEGVISAGNTGAVVAGALMSRRFLPGIKKPAIAVTVPSPVGWSVLLDVGANVNPRPSHLFNFGLMGLIYAKQMLGQDNPSIGLLNIGTEEAKGNDLAKETIHLFNQSPLRDQFHGNVEGRDIFRGVVDVIVCEGFVGNIVLKCCEGMVDFLMEAAGQELLCTLRDERELGRQALSKLHRRYHHSEVGGAPLLGIDGVCMICHGASDARAIRNALGAAKQFRVVNKMISQEMEHTRNCSKVEAEASA
ncbi:Phosphate acyltransferase [Planctomycetes bacterium Pan216]|uniref:Phosphate acyltransferase n=1 Tax=Kolteria novifilia TaxID=2527975 RepID=A0A518B4E5_9BACT|nr:Phosphate acyltransferase [Planctomycetes bacterium Pan216]